MDFLEPNDQIETEPGDLLPLVRAVLTASLAKQLAGDYRKPWSSTQETALQEKISELVAEARNKGLETFKLISVKPSGARFERELSVEKISSSRTLQ